MRALLLLVGLASSLAGPVTQSDCVARQEATVVTNDNATRFTVISERVIRVESAPFVDDCTLTIVRRNTPSLPSFEVRNLSDNALEIQTAKLRLVYNATNGWLDGISANKLSITLIETNTTWRPGTVDQGNLGGTISSWNEVDPVDLLNGTKPFQPGVLSKDGWAVVNDTETPRFTFEGRLWLGSRPWFERAADKHGGKGQDFYFFGCGRSYRECLGDFVMLSGPIPLPPMASFGIWWSHYENYDAQTIKSDVLDKFLEYKIPLNVLQLDVGWHKNTTNDKCSGYNGYDWNEGLFPDPVGFTSAVKSGVYSDKRPLKLLLNSHNFLGLDKCQNEYDKVKNELPEHIKPKNGNPVKYNVTNRALMTAMFDVAMGRNASGFKTHGSRPDYWWHDGALKQWSNVKTYTGLSPTAPTPISGPESISAGNLFWSVYVHDSYIRYTAPAGENRPMVTSRYAWLGQHRYCCGFSGDQQSLFTTLEAEVRMTANAANVAFAHWSHDIGGFFSDPTPDLYLRWMQFGALSPVFRSHGTKGSMRDYWNETYASVFPMMREALALRAELAPYLYRSAREAHDTGVAAVHPLFIDWPMLDQTYESEQQLSFMHGSDILVRPIVEAVSGDSATLDVWLPPSETGWFAWSSGELVAVPATGSSGQEGTTVTVSAALSQLPLFVRGGAVIPLLPAGTLDATSAGSVNWAVFLGNSTATNAIGASGKSTRYIDGMDSTKYEGTSGEYATQLFSWTMSTAGETETLQATLSPAQVSGGFSLPAESVLHSIEIRGRDKIPSKATMNGDAMTCEIVSDPCLTRPVNTAVCVGPNRYALDAPAVSIVIEL